MNEDFVIKDGVLLSYNGKDAKVVIPYGVKSIGENAFRWHNKSTVEVVLPKGVCEIKKEAFKGCTSLKKINLPESLQKIETWAFYGCKNLEEINGIENVQLKVRDIFSDTAFFNNKSIIITGSVLQKYSDISEKSYEIPYGITEIADMAFSPADGKDILSNVIIPDTVKKIGANAFFGRKKLKKIVIPSSVEEIEYNKINGNYIVDEKNPNYCSIDGILYSKDGKKLISVPTNFKNEEFDVPETVTEIGQWIFKDNKNIRKIILPDTVKIIEDSAFEGCSHLEEINLDKVMHIGGKAFYACHNLSNIEMKAIKTIGDGAFADCEKITDIKLPDGLTHIGEYAFCGCNLNHVVVPKTVSAIGIQAFSGAKILEIYDNIHSYCGNSQGHIDLIVLSRTHMWNETCFNGFEKLYEHTIIVRSSVDDSVKYSVKMPVGQKYIVQKAYFEAWGSDANFDFTAIDSIFKELTADAKLNYALERLYYQVGITADTLDTLKKYVTKNALAILKRILEEDDAHKMALMEPYGILKNRTVDEFLDMANEMGAIRCAAWILEWQNRKNIQINN